ncbi:flavin-dependent monooxygenase [Pseudomaricurvus alkylphenolicus]|uniref:acyl-CoA dehydrogenase family protein n=1 Tax=Pseudomaricurvus alkylphenolicus TaxID=1306991 RepID=UPI00141D9FFA|nr:acyl-CoA dehydrogenase family protein [Pseudomaricurvus alkylphenolicus]NIB45001.1 flavin-dependent monooxygenase [Pseudomaricurvus alkylphenolicus]
MSDLAPSNQEAQKAGEALKQRVREILPIIAKNAEKTDANRSVAEENIELLKAAGFTRALQPKAFGGLEIEAPSYGPILMEIAENCSSTAWVAGLLAQHSHMIAIMSEELQQEIWGKDTSVLVSSSVAPILEAKPVDGGVILDGTWGWSSGCDHADWALLGFKRAVPELDNMMIPHMACVPRTDYEIIDDWHTAGLKGTGSKTLKLKNVFVPEHRIDGSIELATGQSKGFGSHPGKIFHSPFASYFALGFSVTALGTAKAFINLYKEKQSKRVRAYTGAKAADSAPAYMRLAESVLQVRAAETRLAQDWSEVAQHCNELRLPDESMSTSWRASQTYVTNQAIEAVNRLYTGSGGSAWFDNNRMQKLWRDVNMAGSHAYSDLDVAKQTYGRHLMDIEPDMDLF